LAPDRGVPFEAIDPGIRDCIAARLACQACEFLLGQTLISNKSTQGSTAHHGVIDNQEAPS
jgi:hypothetical protein